MPATPLFALIYEEGYVKLPLVLEVLGGHHHVLHFESFPIDEQPHDKRNKTFDNAHTSAAGCG